MSSLQQNLSKARAVSKVLRGEVGELEDTSEAEEEKTFKKLYFICLSWVCHGSESHNIQADQAIIHNY